MTRRPNWRPMVLAAAALLIAGVMVLARDVPKNPVPGTIVEVQLCPPLVRAQYENKPKIWDCMPYQGQWTVNLDGQAVTLDALKDKKDALKSVSFTVAQFKGDKAYVSMIEASTK